MILFKVVVINKQNTVIRNKNYIMLIELIIPTQKIQIYSCQTLKNKKNLTYHNRCKMAETNVTFFNTIIKVYRVKYLKEKEHIIELRKGLSCGEKCKKSISVYSGS